MPGAMQHALNDDGVAFDPIDHDVGIPHPDLPGPTLPARLVELRLQPRLLGLGLSNASSSAIAAPGLSAAMNSRIVARSDRAIGRQCNCISVLH